MLYSVAIEHGATPMVAMTGYFDGNVIVPDEPVKLRRGQKYIVHLEPVEETLSEPPKSALQSLVENAVDDPTLPVDGSLQHDHYLYGTPKKPPRIP